MKKKLSKNEWSWILYDVGNSAFILLVATIIPIYLKTLVDENSATVFMGYLTSICTLIVAIIGPILGAMSDSSKSKMPIFLSVALIGAVACGLLSIPMHWLMFLIIFGIAKVGCSSSLIFYDAMLVDVTDEDRIDKVSTLGYALGYIGSCIPFLISLVLVLLSQTKNPIIDFQLSVSIAFLINAVWWIVLTIPLVKNYRRRIENNKNISFKNTFNSLLSTIKEIAKTRHILLYLIAFFFYIDAVYTIIDLSTAYGADLGFDTTGLLVALLITQIVAFPCSILFGILTNKFKINHLLLICIVAYFLISIVAVFMFYQWQFWLLAVMVGMFQGGIQALSRSYFTKIIPADRAASYFSILDIFGKGSSALGTFLVALISDLTNNNHFGVIVLPIMLVIGLVLYILADRSYKKQQHLTK